MPHFIVTALNGDVKEIDGEPHQTLMEVIRDEGVEIEALCGGCCSCATCHVYIDPEYVGKLPPMSEDEDMLLEGSSHRSADTSRLSCQIQVTEQLDGLKLAIAPTD